MRMAEDGFMWIYLVFFMIPLARIIPRLVRKWQNKNKTVTENQYNSNFQRENSIERTNTFERPESVERTNTFERPESVEKPLDEKMKVLGEINRGSRDFNQIQKNINIGNQKLENILKKFEDEGLMKVIKKNGVTGSKIELHPTEKGYKEFHK